MLFLLYVYYTDHRDFIEQDEVWTQAFKRKGLSDYEISDISHDDTNWYYKGISTCVGYGDYTTKCPMSEVYCSALKTETYGNPDEQASAETQAIQNSSGAYHPSCPLITWN